MGMSVEEFDAARYCNDVLCTQQQNVLSNDKLREHLGCTGKELMVPYKKKLFDHIVSEDGPIANGLIHTFLPVYGGAGNGKNTLLDHWPDMESARTDPRVLIDDSASGLHNDHLNTYIPLMFERGLKSMHALNVGAPILDAYARNAARGAGHNDESFFKKHLRAQRGFVEICSTFGNDPRCSFEGIVNPRTPEEQKAQPNPSFDGLQPMGANETCRQIKENGLLAFSDDEASKAFSQEFPQISPQHSGLPAVPDGLAQKPPSSNVISSIEAYVKTHPVTKAPSSPHGRN